MASTGFPDRQTAQKPWRVLISGGLVVGGAQTHITLLCRVLRDAGTEVTIASASTNMPPEVIDGLRKLGARIVVSPFGFGRFQALGKLWAFLAWPLILRHDYDVVCCVGEGKLHLWTVRFARKDAWRIYHELVIAPQAGTVSAEVARRMDAVLANSRIVGAEMRDVLGEIPIRSIPFLTDDPPMSPMAREKAGETLRISFLGRLAPHKRAKELIDSWPDWMKDPALASARLDIYGGDYDGEGPMMEQRIKELGLEKSVRLHGVYSGADLPGIFARTDIAVLPSRYEGLPLVLVEAMRAGVPIVATSAGGTAELGEENLDAIVTEGTGWSEFEAGLKEMALRVRAGEIDPERLRAWAESRYGFDRVAPQWREALLNPDRFFGEMPEVATNGSPRKIGFKSNPSLNGTPAVERSHVI